MNEENVRALVEQLFIHVAALPWRDQVWTRSEINQIMAKEQIVDLTVRELLELNKENENGTKETTDRETTGSTA